MKRIVWENKSNGQLCVTIPKNSGVKDGDIVTIEKQKIHSVVFSSVTGDLLHYGHLRILEAANNAGDLHVCGVLTDDAIKSYKTTSIATYKERTAIIGNLRCVDMLVQQKSFDPTDNLKELREQFPHAQIVVVYGSNWKEIPGAAYIKKIGAKIIQPDFYEKLSEEKMLKKLGKRVLGGKEK